MKKTFSLLACTLSMLLVLPAAAQVPAYVPTEGLVGWWPFCGNANDVSGNGHNGNAFETSLSQDRFGNSESAYYFDGVNDYIQVPHHPELNSLPFSISFWMKANTQIGGAKIFNKVCCSSWNGWDIEVMGATDGISTMHFEYYNATCQGIYQTYCSPVPYPTLPTHDDVWHHFVFSVDSTQANVYLDGNIVMTQGWDGPPTAPITNVALDMGRYGFGNSAFYQGLLDDVGVWGSALTETEVLALYNAQNGGCAVSEPLFQPGGGVTDIDGNTYSTVLINNQEWMAENLNVSSFCNGDPITNASVWPEWYNIVEPRRCAYEANEAYRDQFGSLYNFWAVSDERNLCPCGWHVPSLAEYQSLETYLGGNEVAAGKIKGVETWIGENVGDLNASGLNMLAGGNVADNFYSSSLGSGTTIWLSTSVEGDGGHFADFRGDRTWAYIDAVYPMEGFYVRCIRDSDNSQIGGCTDLLACNYSDTATVDDGSCLYIGSSCDDGNSLTVDDSINENCNCSGTTLPTACTSLPSNLQQGLVGFWPFCGNANDESGNGNDGVVNGANLTTDRFGFEHSAYEFDGVSSFINIGDSLQGGQFTYNLWMHPNFLPNANQEEDYVLISNLYNTEPYYGHNTEVAYNFNGQITAGVSDGTWQFTGPVFPADVSAWTMVTMTYSGDTLRLYKNGILAFEEPWGGFINDMLDTYIGARPNNVGISPWASFNGTLDDVGIWNRALNPAEVQDLLLSEPVYPTTPCTSLPSNLQQGLVGYWPFCGNANDESGNGNNGVVNGATLTEDRFGNAGKAYGFDGVDDFIITENLNLNGSFTASCFINYSNYTSYNGQIGGTIISNFSNQLMPNGWEIGGAAGTANLGVGNGEFGVNSNQNLPLNEWHHFVVVCDAIDSTTTLFLDGNSLESTQQYVTVDPSQAYFNDTDLQFVFGARANTPQGIFFNGAIDDIGIWNRALTPEEVQELYTLDACTFTVYDTLTVFETVFDTVYTYETVYDTVTTYISVTDTLIIDVLLGLEPTGSSNTLLLYPNPASSQLTIDYGNFASMAGYTLTIFDSAGSTVHSTAVFQQQETLDLASWSSGAYQVVIYNAQGVPIDTRTIIIQ